MDSDGLELDFLFRGADEDEEKTSQEHRNPEPHLMPGLEADEDLLDLSLLLSQKQSRKAALLAQHPQEGSIEEEALIKTLDREGADSESTLEITDETLDLIKELDAVPEPQGRPQQTEPDSSRLAAPSETIQGSSGELEGDDAFQFQFDELPAEIEPSLISTGSTDTNDTAGNEDSEPSARTEGRPVDFRLEEIASSSDPLTEPHVTSGDADLEDLARDNEESSFGEDSLALDELLSPNASQATTADRSLSDAVCEDLSVGENEDQDLLILPTVEEESGELLAQNESEGSGAGGVTNLDFTDLPSFGVELETTPETRDPVGEAREPTPTYEAESSSFGPLGTDDEPLNLQDSAATDRVSDSTKAPRSAPQLHPRVGKAPSAGGDKSSILSGSLSFSSLFATTQLVGLDFGANSVKYVVLKKAARGFKLVNCGMHALPQLPPDATQEEKARVVAEILRQKFRIKAYKNALITSVVSGLEVAYRNLQIPQIPEKERSNAVLWACRKDFPFPIESSTLEYRVIQGKNKQSQNKSDVFIAAAQKEVVLNHVKMLTSAEVTPAKISTVPSALWNLMLAMDRKLGDDYHAIIDLGGSSSHITFMKNSELLFAREISTAGEDITDVLTGPIFADGKEINVTREKAEAIKRRFGHPGKTNDDTEVDLIPLKEIAVLMGPVLEKLVKEIRTTIDYFKEKFAVEAIGKIFLTGGTALMKNIPAYLSRELNVEVEVLNPFQFISTKSVATEVELKSIGPRFAVAAGLALDNKKELNLLPQEIRGARASQHMKKMFRYVSAISVLAMIFLSQNVKRQLNTIEAEFRVRQTEYETARPRREKFLALQKDLTRLKRMKKAYVSSLELEHQTANHLKAISNLIPKNIALTSLQLLQRETQSETNEDLLYLEEVMILNGVAFQNNSMEGINLANFLLELEKSNYFYDISLQSQKIREDGSLEFRLECVI